MDLPDYETNIEHVTKQRKFKVTMNFLKHERFDKY